MTTIRIFKNGEWTEVSYQDYQGYVIGDFRKEGTIVELSDTKKIYKRLVKYYNIGYDKCPNCKSKTTWHSQNIKDDVTKGNTVSQCIYDKSREVLLKQDICLKCGLYWAAELFVWDILTEDELNGNMG